MARQQIAEATPRFLALQAFMPSRVTVYGASCWSAWRSSALFALTLAAWRAEEDEGIVVKLWRHPVFLTVFFKTRRGVMDKKKPTECDGGGIRNILLLFK
jgi:hypothetical protein